MKTKLFLFFTFLCLAINAQVSQAERQALIDFYNATDGDNWTNNTNWDTDINSTSDVKTWHGVTATYIDGVYHVRDLVLTDNNLTGTLPDLSQLTELQGVSVATNKLTGNINIDLFPKKLKSISLNENNFTGDFSDFSSFTALEKLFLIDTNFTGVISEEFFPNTLSVLFLSGNTSLEGDLDFSSFKDLYILKVNNTKLNFLKLPRSVTTTSNRFHIKDTPNLAFVEVPYVSDFTNLEDDDFDIGVRIVPYNQADKTAKPNILERDALKKLYQNKSYTYANTLKSGVNDTEWLEVEVIEGETRVTEIHTTGLGINDVLPSEIGALTELKYLHVPSSSINSIPKEINNMTKLEELYLNNNFITSLPNEFYSLVNLRMLNINNNQLTSIASGLGDLINLEQLYFSNTQVDLVPTTIGNLKKLETLEFANTKISLLPPEIGGLVELTRLVAAPNNIASIPSEFGQLTKLTYLDFANCELSNTPAAFANLTELETLFLNDNELQVVAGLGGFTKLKFLRLHNNRLGEDNSNFNTDLPEDMSDLVLLEELTLYNNQLTKLPVNIGNLNKLTSLKIYSNRLSSLPNSIGSLSSLVELHVEANELTSLPTTIGGLTSLEKLYISSSSSNNKLTSLPDEIGDLSNLKELYIENMYTYQTDGTYIYHLESLPTTMNKLTSLEVLEASNSGIGGLVDLRNLINLTRIQLHNNKIEDLKIDAPVSNFNTYSGGTYSFNLSNNSYLTCVEVPTLEVSNWETRYASYSSIADNGIAFSDSCTGFRVPQSEREALVAIYKATNGGEERDTTTGVTWVGTNWSSDATELTNVGSWEGVTTEIINGQKHVTRLELGNYKNLSGSIPKEIKDLTELTYLDLSNGSIASMATEIGDLGKLTYLSLASNSLESLPTGIGNFTSLVELGLSGQRKDENSYTYTSTLTSLPDEIGNIASLEKLDLSSNGLTSLPSGIGNFTNLKELRLNSQATNPVRGELIYTLTNLPDEIGSITSLEKLYLNNNVLTSLPSTINGLTSLVELHVEANELTSLPTTIGGLTSLEKLYISSSSSNNKLTSLPDEIGDLSNLKELYIENMYTYQTDGTYIYHLESLPTTMNKLTSLEVLEASNSGIGGLVDLRNLINLTRIQLHNNKIEDLKIDAPVSNFNTYSGGTYSFNLSNNSYLTCVEVPTLEVSNWETRYASYSSIADNGIAFSDSCTGFRVPQSEREALVAIYKATNGGEERDTTTGVTWVGTNWSSDATELTNVGSWEGVTTEIINGQKHVTRLELGNYKNLSGSIPKEIKDLTELTYLDLSNGSIASMATEIGDLGKLTYLSLASNSLESLPTGIGNFTSLVELGLSGQRKDENSYTYTSTLTSLPDEIGNIASLEKLDLSSNGLTSLPSGIGNFTNLKELRLNSQATNPVRGELIYTLTNLPDEIGSITSLEKLYLNNNVLTSLPSTINGLTSLVELHVEANELTSLPTTIGGLTSLEKLYISSSSSNNKLTSLPDEIGDLSNLKELYIENMYTYQTDGTYIYHLESLPTTMNKLTSLEVLEASNSGIGGLVDLRNLINLTRIQLHNNKIEDLKIDAPVSNFNTYSGGTYSFNLSNNSYLTCVEVPTLEVSNWETRYASYSSIADNGIAFSDSCTGFRVPQSEREALVAIYKATNGGEERDATTGVTWVGTNWSSDATELTNVGSWEGVTTEIINGQKHVTRLELGNYKNLSGSIPKEIKDLTELTYLDLSNGSIASIATEIGDLGKLTYLSLASNSLESLPTGIGNFTSLVELGLSGQRKDENSYTYTSTLTSLPDEIGNIASLEKLDLSSNGLTSLPSGIGNFTNLKELRLNSQATNPVRGELIYTLTNLPDEIGNIATLEKLDLEYNILESLPSSITNLIVLKNLDIRHNRISGALDLSKSESLNTLEADYNNILSLKIAVSPTIFGTNEKNPSSNRLGLKRNALGCIEVPSDELVAWQLSFYNEEGDVIDNGVVYSDNCAVVTNNSIPDIEREALIAVYNSTNGGSWKNDLSNAYNGVTWVNDAKDNRNVGAWFGVTTAIVNGQKHVTKVELNSNQLDGTIPSVIKNLTKLKTLKFDYNAVSEIAPEIGELSNLEQLTFNHQYSYEKSEYVLKMIPVEINNILSLKNLSLTGIQLEGNLDFSSLVNLESLSVNSNQITGLKIGVPPSVFDNTYVSESEYRKSFAFSSNTYLNCIAVPQNTIADWESSSFATSNPNIVWGQDCSAYNNVPEDEMQALVDMYNNLDGANWTNSENWTGNFAKALISNPYNATKWNGITTKIVDGGKHITDVSLSSNKLKGEIPESFSNLSKLTNVQLSSNDISGALPSSIGNLTSLETLYLNSNKIESLPAEMTRMLKLKTIYLQNNEIMGKVPDFTEASTLERLYISSNKFQFGDFEDEFITYQNLKTFSYTSQEKVGEEENIDFGDGFDKTLEAVVSGTNNTYQWYKNYNPITDATNSTFEIANATQQDAGFYYCRVTNSIVTGLTIETERVTLTFDTALSTKDEVFSNVIKLYPNPVTNVLQIQNDSDIIINKIEIYNLLGKKIATHKNPGNSVDVIQLAKGIYIVNVFSDDAKMTKRIVKE
ncbi:Por secretion system C-terminal sorting domain-containing protein [Polaribacter sp. KT25b]|uniref:leucine-rich repeat domain-containing protein n=1 Tax=Polaribacter sp. KT25b TaxID=1855336 RepID=UPI0008798352|nr:leucine-rich repeat domain-containing protein [Polaribacter sp. KT25b]SDR67291.1 Por secretion system C-terminal sorting domain-containing protein [Polaribacter sp. KT25b]